jgi:hypothetical protein
MHDQVPLPPEPPERRHMNPVARAMHDRQAAALRASAPDDQDQDAPPLIHTLELFTHHPHHSSPYSPPLGEPS